MSLKFAQLSAAGNFKKTDRVVIATDCKDAPIRGEVKALNMSTRTKAPDIFAVANPPKADSVRAGRSQQRAVGGKHDSVNSTAVPPANSPEPRDRSIRQRVAVAVGMLILRTVIPEGRQHNRSPCKKEKRRQPK